MRTRRIISPYVACPVRLYHIFSHYPTKGATVLKKNSEQRNAFTDTDGSENEA